MVGSTVASIAGRFVATVQRDRVCCAAGAPSYTRDDADSDRPRGYRRTRHRGGRGHLRAPARPPLIPPPGGRAGWHRGGDVRGRRVAHRTARPTAARLQDRPVPREARRRPAPRRVPGRRCTAGARRVRRHGAADARQLPPPGRSRPAGGLPPPVGGGGRADRAVPALPRRQWPHRVSDVGDPPAETESGLPLQPFYSADDTPGLPPPGDFPFTRGVRRAGSRSRLWTMRQYAGFGSAEQTNERFRYLLAAGQTGLSCAFDLPTQMGYDSDDPMAAGEVGKVGVAIDSLEDMEVLLKDIPLDKVSTSMTINATASILLALYVAVGKQQGDAASQLVGTVQNDILKEYIARGTYIYPPKPSMRLITDIFAYCGR